MVVVHIHQTPKVITIYIYIYIYIYIFFFFLMDPKIIETLIHFDMNKIQNSRKEWEWKKKIYQIKIAKKLINTSNKDRN